MASVQANHGLRGDDLLVYACTIDEGPTIKRWRARARGRVARIRKRTCHITIRLIENPSLATRQAPQAKAAAVREDRPKADPGSKSQTSTRKKKKEVNA